jgi:photosystem II stability/assembly factor-like uncharacterized protein
MRAVLRTMLLLVLGGSAAVLAADGPSTSVGNADPLARPARVSPLAEKRLVAGIARAGSQALVAVGQRGHILRSVDGGRSWAQASVPVSSDLTAVSFVDAQVGYAVGHDGVVLGSRDGGATWDRLLDGVQANQLVLEHMQKRAAQPDAGEADRALLSEAQRNVELGPDKPFLDVWFANANEGFVVGAYNLVFRTIDGGKSWEPWFDRTDNPRLLNLYAIRPAGQELYVAGEGGLLLKLDPGARRFRALASPYQGSYFGVLGVPAGVLAYGMRGQVFLSRDAGQSWSPVVTGLSASITAADLGPDGQVVLVDQGGNVAVSRGGGEHFVRVPLPATMPAAAVVTAPAVAGADRALVLGGARGLHVAPFKDQ